MFDHHTDTAALVDSASDPAEQNGHTVQVPIRACSVPPTGMRLARILEMFRVHLHSVARQVGPEELLKYVKDALRQDFQFQAKQHNTQS